jgi:very-short-patch-repair endonuclease
MWWKDDLEKDGIDHLIFDQGGVVSRAQLLTAGWKDDQIRQRVRARHWRRVHPGVYASFTGPLDYHANLLAGLLYAGAGAMWSHHTAAEQLGLIRIDTGRPVHLTVPEARRVTKRPRLVIHRSRQCLQRRHTVVPPRSSEPHAVLDVVSVARSFDDASSTVLEALQSGKVTAAQLNQAMAGRRGLRFRRDLRPIVSAAAEGAHSLLEVHYLREVERRHGLPAGTRQRAVENEFTDVAYEGHGLVVELDGRFHLEPEQRRRDMDRDNRAAIRNERTLRYGWHDVTVRPCLVAAQVDTMLRRSGPTSARPCGPTCALAEQPTPARKR